MKEERSLVAYIASSLDGYIAGPGDNLDFLSAVQTEGEDYGYAAFLSTVDTVLMGRRTYDWVTERVEFPHSDKTSYIWTRASQPSRGNLHFYGGDLGTLVRDLKARPGKNIFCDGGAQLFGALLQADLIDELILSVVPVLLGSGIRLFPESPEPKNLRLSSARPYPSGLVQMHYTRPTPASDAFQP
jgi:dihydrofolate reductase